MFLNMCLLQRCGSQQEMQVMMFTLPPALTAQATTSISSSDCTGDKALKEGCTAVARGSMLYAYASKLRWKDEAVVVQLLLLLRLLNALLMQGSMHKVSAREVTCDTT